MSVPIATSPGRSGFGPQLSLSYDSGSGNGPFGFGWSLSLPSITRKTDKGLPRYDDANESDVFILSGAEDLVPEFEKDAAGNWVLRDGKHVIHDKLRVVDGVTYNIRRYRPRTEGLFARIERWTNQQTGEIHWRSITRDNITTLYGKDNNSRIFDPADPDPLHPTHIFSWLICESYDDKGNVMVYRYKEEDSTRVALWQAHERNRTDSSRSANRYLKSIRYGNHAAYFPRLAPDQPWPMPLGTTATDGSTDWYFEIVLDYGEHDLNIPLPGDAGEWEARLDSFSSYRAGFEVRTYRLCQRVLMFHHFEGEAGVEKDCLVRSTDFTYSYEENPSEARNPIYSFLLSVTQSGHLRQSGGYLKRSLPPLEFEYTKPIVQDVIHEVDAESLVNLPIGLDGASYQWTDLDGEGLSGILTEQGGSWFYKRNTSANHFVSEDGRLRTAPRFEHLEQVALQPVPGLSGGAQFLDLAGDGQIDLVQMEGPVRGYYERTAENGWVSFQPFTAWPNLSTRDPNLKFVDLTGDGHADILLTEDEVFTWHPSLAEEGFGPGIRVDQALDEEHGPRLVFADGTQSIYVADMSGDGLPDLVRIRDGEVCYWPNLGYGCFGPKVTMDNAPWFDEPDQFDQRRIRLADVDGSGTTDIIYLHRDGVRLYFNQSGNSWGAPQPLAVFPRVDDLVSITAIDLLGNGTACLVWSSPLAGDAQQPMRYVDLIGGQKPHLLVRIANNLGAETAIEYAPSTKFYLQDKQAGKSWITRLPFPVHCVEKVTVVDKWRQTSFSTAYSYHHGYFNGPEREFRGFGRVEQIDFEDYGRFAAGNAESPYITGDQTLYQPPVKTVTWFHTGAFLDRERILAQFADEYFPEWLEAQQAGEQVLGDFRENHLPEPDLSEAELTDEEWAEALRACKGMTLHQEVYELDVDALTLDEQKPVKLFTAAYHNCQIRRLQPRGENRHAVFYVTESEAITYHYELDLRPATLTPDPRIAHTLNLSVDEYGNIQQSVAVVYPRLGEYIDATLMNGAQELVQKAQSELHLAYTETRYTNDVPLPDDPDPDNYRLRLPCEVLTNELTGIRTSDADDAGTTGDPVDDLYFTLDELRAFKLSDKYQQTGAAVAEIAYHALPDGATPQKRLVEHVQMFFFVDDPGSPGALTDRLELGRLGRLALPYETYKLALSDELLDEIFTDAAGNKLDRPIKETFSARELIRDKNVSGYLADEAGRYWICSGTAGFAPDAAEHFYLPERYTDPFGNVTALEYDRDDLFIQSSTDPLGNTTRVTRFDYRVLAPAEMQDINDNVSEVLFDALGLPVAMAVKGKGDEADDLAGFTDELANPEPPDLAGFFGQPNLDGAQARAWLGNATARHLYYFGEGIENGETVWGVHPACACSILREQHVRQLAANVQSPLQAAFEYSDGGGNVLVKKIQAEPEVPGGPLRWVASGKTVRNNKGKPVKQYEPYFSVPDVGLRFEEPAEVGVTPVIYYDAVGRVIRTEAPDGSYSRVEFSPWQVLAFDQNDTVTEPGNRWFAENTAATATPEENTAAQRAAEHAGTPALTILDSLGREVITVAHNRTGPPDAPVDEKYVTFTKLDAEGKPLWIVDPRDNRVMQYITPFKRDGMAEADWSEQYTPCYDIAGNLLYQHSMDAGDRWTLNDAAGKPMFAWDSRGHTFRTEYDELRRPSGSFVAGDDPLDAGREIQFEKVIYGDTPGNGLFDLIDLTNDRAKPLNLRGKPYQHYDTAGLVTSLVRDPLTGADEAFDFKGNLLRSTRHLAADYKTAPDWSGTPVLETESFSSSTRYDALNRPVQLVVPHSDQPGTTVNVIQPGYNEANLLERVDAWLNQGAEPGGLLDPAAANLHAVTDIDYDAKGQRIRIACNEAAQPIVREYSYDPKTFRLIHLVTTRPSYPDPAKRTLQDLSYTYDPIGNITHIADRAQPLIFFDNACVDASNEYSYDALYRLVAATGREHGGQDLQPDWDDGPRMGNPIPHSCSELRNYVETYRYDPAGNIMQMIHHLGSNLESPGNVVWNRRYQYRAYNNQLRCTSIPGEAPLPDYSDVGPHYAQLYTYDAHGSMTAMPHLPLMDWDFKDRLVASSGQVVNENPPHDKVPVTVYYVYAAGQRVRKVTENQSGALSKQRIYLSGFEIYRKYDPADSVTLERETLHIMDDKQRIALVETKTIDAHSPISNLHPLTRYQLGNHLGSASLELDAAGDVISYEEYYPYGNTSYQAGDGRIETSPKRYRYTGKERDEETGLYYHGARYYAGWLGRWGSCDPAGIVAGPNLYMSMGDHPLRYVDPSGAIIEIAVTDQDTKAVLSAAEQMMPGKVGQTKQELETMVTQSLKDLRQFSPVARRIIEHLEKSKNKIIITASLGFTSDPHDHLVSRDVALAKAAPKGYKWTDEKGIEGLEPVVSEAMEGSGEGVGTKITFMRTTESEVEGIRTPFVDSLMHELVHAWQNDRGKAYRDKDPNTKVRISEIEAVYIENMVRSELNDGLRRNVALRTSYDGQNLANVYDWPGKSETDKLLKTPAYKIEEEMLEEILELKALDEKIQNP